MTQKEKQALALKNQQALRAFDSIQSNTYGNPLWDEVKVIAMGYRAANTDDTALEEGSDIKALASPALYYQNTQFGLQLVAKYNETTVGYIHLMHDKDGDAIVDENHVYDLKDVVANRDFTFTNDEGEEITIAKGKLLAKAYAAS